MSLQHGDELVRVLQYVKPLGRIRVAVVYPCDEVSLSAALDARTAGVIEPVLIGPRARLEAVAQKSGANLREVAIEDVTHSHAAATRAVELALKGEVEALMKGSLHTDELMTAVVKSALRTDRRMSHCFIMQTPAYPRLFIITDAAINIAPTLQDKADIIRNAVDLLMLGIARPRVAILAAVETINPNMPATLDAAALCKMADRGQITGAMLDGPLAFDNAVSAAAARTKGIVSEVAGAADILVVPDLEAGNMLAKQLEYLGGAASAGIVLGARVPIILTSRADSREARIARAPPLQWSRGGWAARCCRCTGAQGSSRGCQMSEPILVLNCGSSSIKFALFDAAVRRSRARRLVRTGRRHRQGQALFSGAAGAARERGKADGRTAARGGGPPRGAWRNPVLGAGARRRRGAGGSQELHSASRRCISLRAPGDRGAARRAAGDAAGVLRHRVPSHARAGRADAAAAVCALGTRRAALRLSRPVL